MYPRALYISLATAVQSSESPGGDNGNILRAMFNSKPYSPDTAFSRFIKSNTPEAEQDHLFFSSLKLYPKLRRSLPSINSARTYKCGSRAFGQKSWYNENLNITKGLKNIYCCPTWHQTALRGVSLFVLPCLFYSGWFTLFVLPCLFLLCLFSSEHCFFCKLL